MTLYWLYFLLLGLVFQFLELCAFFQFYMQYSVSTEFTGEDFGRQGAVSNTIASTVGDTLVHSSV